MEVERNLLEDTKGVQNLAKGWIWLKPLYYKFIYELMLSLSEIIALCEIWDHLDGSISISLMGDIRKAVDPWDWSLGGPLGF